jgi:hypothetical protein
LHQTRVTQPEQLPSNSLATPRWSKLKNKNKSRMRSSLMLKLQKSKKVQFGRSIPFLTRN